MSLEWSASLHMISAIIDGDLHCYRHNILGLHSNEDVWIAAD